MSFDLVAFEKWLTKRGQKVQKYQPRTIQSLVQSTRRLLRLHAEGTPPDEWPTHPAANHAVKRAKAFLESDVDIALRAAPPSFLAALTQYRAIWIPPSQKRQREVRSIDDAGWIRLLETLRKNERIEARVIELLASTGIRISDALRTERKAVLDGVRTGSVSIRVKGGKLRNKPVAGAPLAWGAIAAAFTASNPRQTTNVASLICPGNPDFTAQGAAYQRVAYVLHQVGADAELAGRVHLHRLRRTFIVQALRDKHDIALVQQAVDHESIATTATYADEPREEAVAAMQQGLARRFGGQKPEEEP